MTDQLAGAIVGIIGTGAIGGVGYLIKSLVSTNGHSGWKDCPDIGKVDTIAIDVGQTKVMVSEIRTDIKEVFPRLGVLEQSVAVLKDRVKKNSF